MLVFVISHLTAHAFLLVSLERAEGVLVVLMAPWRTIIGTVVLTAAFIVHYANALWSVYTRRTLRMSRWEWMQLVLGLFIPVLLILHVSLSRVGELMLDLNVDYDFIIGTMWIATPWAAILQAAALLTVWIHACIGIHFWLRTKAWYRERQVYFGAAALLLPTLALAGYLAAGNEILRHAVGNPDYLPN